MSTSTTTATAWIVPISLRRNDNRSNNNQRAAFHSFKKIPSAALSLQATTSDSTTSPLSSCSSTSRMVLKDDKNNEKKIKHVMAPMVGQSDYAFRRLCRFYGTDLAYTQMLHVKHVVLKNPKILKHHLDFGTSCFHPTQFCNSQIECLRNWNPEHFNHQDVQEIIPLLDQQDDDSSQASLHEEGGPLIVQLAGNDVQMVLDGAQTILESVKDPSVITGFDLNCGCPQGIARKGRYGAYLIEQDQDLVMNILKTLRLELPRHVMVSAKLRLPREGTDEAIRRRMTTLLQETGGIDFLALHGRTLVEKKTMIGPCHFEKLKLAMEIAHSVDPSVPIIANGGIQHHQDIDRVLEMTGAAAIMSSEALLEHANLFQTPADDNKKDARDMFKQQIKLARQYICLCARYPPLPVGSIGSIGGSFKVVKGHLLKILFRYFSVNLDLSLQMISRSTCLVDAWNIIAELERRYNINDDKSSIVYQCPSAQLSWYQRHWKPPPPPPPATLEERKQQTKKRIQQLVAQRQQVKQQREQEQKKGGPFFGIPP